MNKQVAWIGTGVMGAPMAGHLLKNGYPVAVYNRSFEKAEALEPAGARVCRTLGEALDGARFVFTMVGYPRDVRALYLGEGGLLSLCAPGSVLVDMTTSSPRLAAELYEAGKARGVDVLDAPVSGGDTGAKNAALSIMVGGDRAAFERVLPLFSCLGKNIAHMGGAGCGQHTKAANQIAVAGATVAMTEAIAYARRAGIDPRRMLEVVGSGAGGSWQISNMGPRVLGGDLAPGFFIEHFIKDLEIIGEEADARGLALELARLALKLYRDMQARGLEKDGTQALIKRY